MHGRERGIREEWRRVAGREGTVEGVLVRAEGPGRGVVLVERGECEGRALRAGARVRVRGLPEGLEAGDRVGAAGWFDGRRAPRNPGEEDFGKAAEQAGLAAVMRAREAWEGGGRDWRRAARRWADRVRAAASRRLGAGLEGREREAATLRGVVLGERAEGEAELFNFYRLSGTMHVFAVSGLHVGLFGAMVWGLGRWVFRLRWRAALWLVLAGICLYALVTGTRPPAIRATVMGAVLIGGFLFRRRAGLANGLGASVPAVLLWDSHQLFQTGFQLSYAVLFSIVLIGGGILRWFEGRVEPDPFLPRSLLTRWQWRWWSARRWLAGLAGVSVAAWLGSAPLMLSKFRLVVPAGVLASLCLVPLVWVMLFLGFLSVLAGPVFPGGSRALNRANAGVARLANGTARVFAELPGGHWKAGRLREEEAVVFDVDDGGGCFYARGGRVLLDCGGREDYEERLRFSFRALGVEAGTLVLSHADGAHCGGVPGLLRDGEVGEAVLPVGESGSPRYEAAAGALRAWPVPARLAAEGMEVGRGKGRLVVLHAPAGGAGGAGGAADDHCLVARYEQAGWRVLLSSDAGMETEIGLLGRGADLRAEVLVIGRHAYDHSGTIAFIREVGPAVVIASEDSFPEGEEIPGWWKEALREMNVRLYTRARHGAVTLRFFEDRLEVEPFLLPGEATEVRRPSS